jgi:hypothetical protein
MDRWDRRRGQSFAGAWTKEFYKGKNGDGMSPVEDFFVDWEKPFMDRVRIADRFASERKNAVRGADPTNVLCISVGII